ncbi:MAG: hypothetical protein WC561_01860 [Candidatus Omnitrophota bacterium]
MMLNTKAKSFITIMIVVALAALALRIFIHKIIRLNIQQNQSFAQNNLKLISTAMENYAKNNKGVYADSVALLTTSTPAYLGKDYIKDSPLRGYEYDCPRLDAKGYSCIAMPNNCKLSGETVYSVSTGGLFISESCDKK